MKRKSITIKLLICLISICITPACKSASIKFPNSEGEIGQAIDGKYDVFSSLDNDFYGNLILIDGQYEFSFENEKEDETFEDISQLVFVQFPNGTYQVEPSDLISPETKLIELDDNEILLVITFEADELINLDNIPIQNRKFFIRYDGSF